MPRTRNSGSLPKYRFQLSPGKNGRNAISDGNSATSRL
jgi:hypothetical protein